ncbi:MAG: 30S ribosomal protein S6 [Oscillospiraceae bacterium]
MAKLQDKYEAVIVFNTKTGEEGIKSLIEKISDTIAKDAVLDSVDEWGKRRLAYAINFETEGYYALFNFTSKPDFPAELDRILKITDGILRSLIVKKID